MKRLTPLGQQVMGIVRAYVAPNLAADCALDLQHLNDLLLGVEGKNYAERVSGLVAGLDSKYGTSMAQDASIQDVAALLEILEERNESEEDEMEMSEEDADEEEQTAGEELMKMLSTYQIPEGDLQRINDLINKIAGTMKSEEPEEEPENKPEIPKKQGEEMSNEDNKAQAMDEKTIFMSLADRMQAQQDVRPVIGEVNVLAMDSAADVYKLALDSMGVKLDGVDPSAFKTIFNVAFQKKEENVPSRAKDMAQDAKAAHSLEERFPGMKNIVIGG